MTLRYRILEEAKNELFDAARFHEEQRPGLGHALFDEYDALVSHARAFPTAGKPVAIRSQYAVRCFQMRRFRYAIFVALVDDTMVVFSVSHHKREPRYWNERIRKISR